MQRNPHVRFGGGRLETQVRLCAGRLPYFLLFAPDKPTLWRYRRAIDARLSSLRLALHPGAQPAPVRQGIPFLGFIVFPQRRRLKRRKGIHFRRRFITLRRACAAGQIPPEKVSASVRGWVNHVRYGNTIGLRCAILASGW